MNTTNGYNLALQRQLVDSKINDISDLKQKLEFSKIGSASDGMSVTRVGHLDDAYMSNGKPVGITLYQLPRSKYEELINVST